MKASLCSARKSRTSAVLSWIVILTLAALGLLFFAGSVYAIGNPRGLTIEAVEEGETLFVGCVQRGPSPIIEPARWVTIITEEAISVTFNAGSYYDGAMSYKMAKATQDEMVSTIVPLPAAGTYTFACMATSLEFTDCDGGDVTVIAEYRAGE